jgi:hypothetical protein
MVVGSHLSAVDSRISPPALRACAGTDREKGRVLRHFLQNETNTETRAISMLSSAQCLRRRARRLLSQILPKRTHRAETFIRSKG